MRYLFKKRQNYELPNKNVDGKQDYQKYVGGFLAWKDVKFQKFYNFPGNRNFERLLLDLLNIKPDCSY